MKNQIYQSSKKLTGKQDIIESVYEYRGICVTCLKSKLCIYHKNQVKPVVFCDEFYSSQIDTSKNNIFNQIISSEGNKERFKGLCQTCENQQNCTFPKPIWGIWQCEDYK